MKQKVTNQTRRKMLIGGAAAASTPLWLNVANAQADTIKIGFPTPLTGPFSAEAQDQVKAAELAIKEFNDAGGFNGRKAELLVRDDKLNPGEAATRTLELIEKDKVNFIVAHFLQQRNSQSMLFAKNVKCSLTPSANLMRLTKQKTGASTHSTKH